MKLSSVVLLSVNLMAASQVAANAADTASFLQDALSPSASASRPVRNSSPAPRASRQAPVKKHSSSHAYVAMTPVVDGVPVRKFVPGRYLPSEADLQPKAAPVMNYAAGSSDVLSGSVSANNDISNAIAPAAAYAMSRPVNQDYMHKVQGIVQKVKQAAKNYSVAHTRSVPGMNPVIPGQVAQIPGASAVLPRIPEPQRATMPTQIPQPPIARSVPMQVPQATPQQYVAASAPVVPLPSLSKWDNAQLDKLIDNNMPENVYAGVNGDMRAGQGNPGVSGTGPTPYPLSSLPINRRGVQPIGAPRASFGSWHGGNNLPQSSFHTYVPVHMAGPMSVKINHFGNSNKTGAQAVRIHTKHAGSSHVAAQSHPAAKAAPVAKPGPVAASYPLYRRYTSMF